ncbi:MAG: hydrogenase maturation nickel metallochaperone HypA [Acidimicrobiaceae bacterium]|nr:hydrogenase maturation nickel metallochaperone HypA [Acidimicrobiaceae bacterium]
MHELGLCDGVVEAICRRAKGRPVDWARVRVGGHAVDPAVITQGVAVAAMGTEAEGLSLDVLLDPMRCRCQRCGAEESIENALGLAACIRCGSLEVEVVGSEHAVLEAVRYRRGDAMAASADSTHRKERTWTPSNS